MSDDSSEVPPTEGLGNIQLASVYDTEFKSWVEVCANGDLVAVLPPNKAMELGNGIVFLAGTAQAQDIAMQVLRMDYGWEESQLEAFVQGMRVRLERG